MAKIHIRMVTGEEFTISNAFHGRTGPLSDRHIAEVQMSFILGKYAALQTDQGKVLNVAQIAYQWVED